MIGLSRILSNPEKWLKHAFLVDQGLYSLFSFAWIILASRSLVLEDFGQFSYAFYLFPLLGVVSLSFVHMPHMFYAHMRRGQEELFTTEFIIHLGIVFMVSLGLFMFLVGTSFKVEQAWLFGLMFLVSQVYDICRRRLLVLKQIKVLLLADSIRFLPLVVLTAMGVTLGPENLLGMTILILAFPTALLVPRVGLKRIFSMENTRRVVAENWRYGNWIFATNATQNIASNFFIYLGIIFLSREELAYLNAPKVVLGSVTILLLAMDNFLTPTISQKLSNKAKSVKSMITDIFVEYRLYYYGLAVVATLVIVCQDRLALLLFDFDDEPNFIWAYMLSAVLLAVMRPLLVVLRAANRNRDLWMISFVTMIVAGLLAFPAMAFFGLKGAIATMLVVNMLQAVLMFYHIQYHDS